MNRYQTTGKDPEEDVYETVVRTADPYNLIDEEYYTDPDTYEIIKSKPSVRERVPRNSKQGKTTQQCDTDPAYIDRQISRGSSICASQPDTVIERTMAESPKVPASDYVRMNSVSNRNYESMQDNYTPFSTDYIAPIN